MADPGNHLSKVLDLITHFGAFAGFKINPSKCELLGLSDRSHMRDARIQATGMQVAHNHITYLGIKIDSHTGTIYPLNYPPPFDKILREFKKWDTLPLSLFAHCQLVKIISFARLLYPLETIRILLRHKDVGAFNSAVTEFIWAGKRPRISLLKRQASSWQGGLNLPHLRGYHIACLSRYWPEFLFWLRTGGIIGGRMESGRTLTY